LITRRDLIEQKASDTFIGRHEEISTLSQLFVNPDAMGFVNLWGLSGIGKTSLLTRLMTDARGRQYLTCYIDLAFCSGRISLLSKLATSLTQPFLADTDNAYLKVKSRYRDIHLKLQGSDAITMSALSQISRLSDFDGDIVEARPAMDRTPLTHNDIIRAENALGSDFQFFRDPTAELARALVLDLNRVVELRPNSGGILIALDRSEKVPENLLTWFREEVFLHLPGSISMIVAGQRPLEDGWDQLLQLGLSFELKPLSEPESNALCTRQGISDDRFIAWAHKISGGIPLFASALCQQYLKDPRIAEGDDLGVGPSETIIERYLSAIAADQRDAVLKGAILRYISSENARAIFGNETASQLLSLMRSLHFVSESPKGFVIHDQVRDYFNRYHLKHNPSRFVELSSRAADYYGECADRGIRRFESLTEELYHRVRSGGSAGLDRLRELFDSYSQMNEPQECEVLLATAQLAGLNDGNWSRFFRAVNLYQRAAFRESRHELEKLLPDADLHVDPDLRGMVFFYYAVTSWYLCDFKNTLTYAKQAVEIFENSLQDGEPRRRRNYALHLNRAIGVIGLTQDRLGYFDEGIATVQRMAQSARDSHDASSLGFALNSSGYFSWHQGHWRHADRFLNESVGVWSKLHSRFGACYPLGHRAALRFAIGDPQYPLEDLRRCIEMSRDANNREMECKSGHNYAEALWASGRFEGCVSVSGSAIDIAESIGQAYFAADAYRVRAMGYLGNHDIGSAASALEKSLELAEKLGARYITTRSQAVAYAARLEGKLRLPKFDLTPWINSTFDSGFGRAAFDFARIAIQAETLFESHLGPAREELSAVLLACGLRLNFNALLIVARELAARSLIENASAVETVVRSTALPRDSSMPLSEVLALSIQRGIRESFNAEDWDTAVATLSSR
jgi:tetratricopeptide (TPR) repeat protein/GTPase SAR1 family protein